MNETSKQAYSSNGFSAKNRTTGSRWKYTDQYSRDAGRIKPGSKKTFEFIAQGDNNFSGWGVRESFESEENEKSLYNKINNINDDDEYEWKKTASPPMQNQYRNPSIISEFALQKSSTRLLLIINLFDIF